ncbi:MAG: hypothetical protein V7L11_29170 [Nostoc sp.]|uniref:hypothetical protein n=1 Tax=Nostoc sp. TaxID=1180 RepID=UPI002FFAE4B6
MPVVANSIKFDTDGWRGIIGDEFTFERLALNILAKSLRTVCPTAIAWGQNDLCLDLETNIDKSAG